MLTDRKNSGESVSILDKFTFKQCMGLTMIIQFIMACSISFSVKVGPLYIIQIIRNLRVLLQVRVQPNRQ